LNKLAFLFGKVINLPEKRKQVGAEWMVFGRAL